MATPFAVPSTNMPTWKPPARDDPSETWTWVTDGGRALATVHREGDGWVADSKTGIRIGWAPSRREATQLVALDRVTGSAVPTEAHRGRVGDVSRAVYIRALGFDPEPEGASYEERYAGTTGELHSWAREKKTAAELDAEIDAALREGAVRRSTTRQSRRAQRR